MSFANPAVTIARGLTDTFAGIAPVTGTVEEKLRAFRTVRDAIHQRLRMFLIIADKK